MKPQHISWLLLFLALLIVGHLGLIYIDLFVCYDYYTYLLNEENDISPMQETECGELEEVYQAAVNKYIAVILALITGGAAAAVVKDKK